MLDTLLNRRLSDAECTAFHAAYEKFIDLLHGLTAQSCKSPLDLLHELARLQSRLMRLQARIVWEGISASVAAQIGASADEFRDPGFVIRPSPPRYRSKSLNRRCSSPNNSRLRISWNWKRHCISLEPYAASTARGSIWRHSSMCFPELSMSGSIIRNSATIRSSTASCGTHFLDILRNNQIEYNRW